MWDDSAIKNLAMTIFKNMKWAEQDCDDTISYFCEFKGIGLWEVDFYQIEEDEAKMYLEIKSVNYELNRMITNLKDKYIKHKAVSIFLFDNFAKVKYDFYNYVGNLLKW